MTDANASLQDKHIVVTGASRGIGRAIAVALAGQGAKVYCVSTREGGCDETIAACGGDAAVPLVCDVADPGAVDALAERVLADGPVHALVNNAGVTRDGLFLRMSVDDFDAVLGINLRGTFLTCRAFARALAKARGGRIVNVGSVVGITGNAGQVNYAASKAGLIGMTKSLAREFAGRGVTANVVAPGFIETDMTKDLTDDVRTESLRQIPLGRLGSPADIAGVVAFLCGDSAAYITGQVLVVDGGMTM